VAAARELVYTRYADDLTFSASGGFDRSEAVRMIHIVESIVSDSGFRIHRKKTRIVPPGARKIVLGLLVDRDLPRLSKAARGRILSHVRGVHKFGLSEHRRHRQFASLLGLVNYVGGLLAFAHDVEPAWAEEISDQWKDALTRSGWRLPVER
jgi:RNA-directed DNA polymerase